MKGLVNKIHFSDKHAASKSVQKQNVTAYMAYREKAFFN